MPVPANYIFLPWVQPGLAANIPDSAVDKLGANQSGVVSLPVRLIVNTEPIDKTVRLYGPGDITGIDPQQVVRVEPRRGTNDFEPNYFPGIEFDRPDFPWLFTPAKSDAQGRLRPWLCLVVVRKQEGVALRSAGSLPLPVLEIKAPAIPGNELPDLSESWAWAHTQVTGSEKSQLQNTLGGDPARSVSRLLCPRRLDPLTEYLACVVPSFDLGVKAGLNQPIPATNKLDPAWLSGAQSPTQITLPVYYHWEFSTGEGGDFEELARKLVARIIPPEVGKRPMDIGQPGFKPQPPPKTLGLEGALRPVKSKSDDWPDAARLPFQSTLQQILNTPWKVATDNTANQDPIVAPPIYGCWQAAVHQVGVGAPPALPTPPPVWPPTFWLNELNLDPRTRVAAAAGTQVVQQEQEQLMASAWEQLGEIEKINQRLRQAQLSRAVNAVYHAKNFSRFSGETFLKIVAPAQSRVVLSERPANLPPTAPPVKTLLTQKIAATFMPSSAVSAPLRRLARPRGVINQPYARTGAVGIGSLISHFNNVSIFGVATQTFAGGETIWVDDTTPAGAILAGDVEGWSWINANPAPYTGTRCHQSAINAGVHQHYFYNAISTMTVGEGDRLFVYIFIDPANPPSEVMLQWHAAGNWEHRAYWGANNITWGVDSSVARRKIGGLPIANGWVRLEVAAADVGLEGMTVDGMAFTLFGGRAYWDRAGKLISTNKGAVTIGRVSDMLPAGGGFIWNQNPPAHWERATAAAIRMHDNFRLQNLSASAITAKQSTLANADMFRGPAAAHQAYLNQLFSTAVFRDVRTEMSTQTIKSAALVSLDPNTTVSARALSGFSISSPRPQTGDPLDPVMDAPTFPQPMYEALRDLSQDYLLPGLEQVPTNTVTTLETNNKFIEAFLVGLNAEMSSELLWRGYPTDQRGTYFQQFWESVGVPAAPDIPPINQWNSNGNAKALGTNVTGAAASGNLVLLIRGDLLRRYPNTVIYAVKAVRNGGLRELSTNPADEKHPIFRGTLEPDVTFLGFDLDADKAVADPGWFFVIQQQPTEPRFGLDEAPFEDPTGPQTIPELKTWDSLNWAHLAKDEIALKALSHVPVTKNQLTPTQGGKGLWGRNAAHMAYITKQLPSRVAIHATEMIPSTVKPKP